ncbi:RNA-binding protein [Geitlerinema sp. PCC 9228]|uniref:RNA recognition motif domain-containing protein n=1 Tax=Geitlerinema sp. PCC 9228 TaxID=111611 RepID=UPI0008F98AFE|nr:RNA-binding protein [Geitlerinema sp. PCC 9228]
MSVRLYVGNLPKEVLDRQELQNVFAEESNVISTKIIKQRKTGKCRGFGFLTVKNEESADEIIEKFNGYMFKDNPLKIEKAQPRTKSSNEKENESKKSPEGEKEKEAKPAAKQQKANKGGKGSKSRRGGGGGSPQGGASEKVQPDPRWAEELEKLKQMLATAEN